MDNFCLHESKGVVYVRCMMGGAISPRLYYFYFHPHSQYQRLSVSSLLSRGGLPLNCKPTACRIFKRDQIVASSLFWFWRAKSMQFVCLATKTRENRSAVTLKSASQKPPLLQRYILNGNGREKLRILARVNSIVYITVLLLLWILSFCNFVNGNEATLHNSFSTKSSRILL